MKMVENLNYGRSQQVAEFMFASMHDDKQLPENVWVSQLPFCNCREQGVVFMFRLPHAHRDAFNIAIFEHRNSDELCALKWFGEPPITWGVTPDDLPEGTFPDKYTHAKTVAYRQFQEMLDWMHEEVFQQYKKSIEDQNQKVRG